MPKHNINTRPIHLGLGASATAQPEFTGLEWYDEYTRRVASDGAEGRLVAMHSFTEDWDVCEMHPKGDEVVLCISGSITLHQEMVGGETASVTLGPGDYAINPPGCWHTADVASEATCLFITAGKGTEHKPRS